MEPSILFEDESLLVIDKPAGWVVNNSETTGQTPTVQNWIEKKQGIVKSNLGIESEFVKRSGIVHRLDKETSGVLIVAKTPAAFENLQGQFKDRSVEKTYKALVCGRVEEKEAEIASPVGRLPWRRERFGVIAGGRQATTLYKVVDYFRRDQDSYSFINLFPKTGRTHQIRVHLKSIGHPVVCDKFYAGRKTARRDLAWCPRLFLHASKIKFSHPVSKEPIEFESPLPQDLTWALYSLKRYI